MGLGATFVPAVFRKMLFKDMAVALGWAAFFPVLCPRVSHCGPAGLEWRVAWCGGERRGVLRWRQADHGRFFPFQRQYETRRSKRVNDYYVQYNKALLELEGKSKD
jgi:hypothetical protein